MPFRLDVACSLDDGWSRDRPPQVDIEVFCMGFLALESSR